EIDEIKFVPTAESDDPVEEIEVVYTTDSARGVESICGIKRTDAVEIRLGDSLSCREQRLLRGDFERLHRFMPVDPDPEIYSVLGTLDFSSTALERLLSEKLNSVELRLSGRTALQG